MYYYDNKRGILINKDNDNVRIKVYPPSNGTFRLKDYPYSFISSKEVSNNSEDKDDIVFYDRLIGDGKAYIDTIPFNSSYDYEIELIGTPNYKDFFGVRQAYSAGYYALANSSSNEVYIYYKDVNALKKLGGLSSASNLRKYSVNWSKGTMSIIESNGTTKQTTFTAQAEGIIGGAVRIFGRSGYGASIVACTAKGFKVSLNGTPIIQFKPVTYNGEAGMYDVVNEVFYGNANTEGSFSVAND